MANFVLQPCKLKDNRFVPTKEEPITLDWGDLLTRVAPSKSYKAKLGLRSMKKGAFVGKTRNNGVETNFIILNADTTGKVKWLLKQDPTFVNRLIEVFRVEDVSWDDKVEEIGL